MSSNLEQAYLDTLDEKELIAYRIACSLGSLFSLNRCNGYLDWIKQREQEIKEIEEMVKTSSP